MYKSQQKGEKIEEAIPKGKQLQQFLKSEKTFFVEYLIVKNMIAIMEGHEETNMQVFKSLYNNLSKQIKHNLLFNYLNYLIWNDEAFLPQIREKTQFFRIVSEWIIVYELKVADLKNIKSQIQFLHDFFKSETNNIFQKVVAIHQVHQDLVQLLGQPFWGQQQQETSQPVQSKKQQAEEIIKLLLTLVQYYSYFSPDKSEELFNCELFLLGEKNEHYKQFVLRCCQYVVSVNDSKKSADQNLEKHQEMEITRIILIFLQRHDISPERVIKLLKMLMIKTSKMVRYAMIVDYVRYYDYLEKTNQYQILEQLQDMVYFRQLIIGQNQITQTGLISNQLCQQMEEVLVPARMKHKILINHEKQLGSYSVLQLQFIIQSGDITVSLYRSTSSKQIIYWKQQKSEDRRVQIILNQDGLYILQFDNSYSWIKGKKISYKLQQYCNGTI